MSARRLLPALLIGTGLAIAWCFAADSSVMALLCAVGITVGCWAQDQPGFG